MCSLTEREELGRARGVVGLRWLQQGGKAVDVVQPGMAGRAPTEVGGCVARRSARGLAAGCGKD